MSTRVCEHVCVCVPGWHAPSSSIPLLVLYIPFSITFNILITPPRPPPPPPQGEAIAYNLREMFGLRVPIISLVIGEGGSGGALAIG